MGRDDRSGGCAPTKEGAYPALELSRRRLQQAGGESVGRCPEGGLLDGWRRRQRGEGGRLPVYPAALGTQSKAGSSGTRGGLCSCTILGVAGRGACLDPERGPWCPGAGGRGLRLLLCRARRRTCPDLSRRKGWIAHGPRSLLAAAQFLLGSGRLNSGTSILRTNVSAGPVGITLSVISQIPCMRLLESLSTKRS